MEPNQMKEGQKVPVPAAFLAGQEKEAKQRETIGEWRRYITHQQRKALDEEGPSAGFRTCIPLEHLKALTPDERETLMAHERAEYDRLKPLADARHTQRFAYVQAGGDAEEFDARWARGGREATLDEIASGGTIEHSKARFSTPY